MATIFVAYGEPEHRQTVLAVATRQAATCGHHLFVYHIHDSTGDSVAHIHEEAETVIEETAPQVPFTVHINTPDETSGLSKSERLLDAVLETDPDYEYAVMGDVERGSLETLTHDSLTEAILNTHSIPVMLVPVAG